MTQTERLWLGMFRQLHGAFFKAMNAESEDFLYGMAEVWSDVLDRDMTYCGGGPL